MGTPAAGAEVSGEHQVRRKARQAGRETSRPQHGRPLASAHVDQEGPEILEEVGRVREDLGYPIADVKVRLFDGKYHDVDSDSRSFEMAGSKGFLTAFKQAQPVIDTMVTKGIIHANKAARHKSELNAKIKALGAAAK